MSTTPGTAGSAEPCTAGPAPGTVSEKDVDSDVEEAGAQAATPASQAPLQVSLHAPLQAPAKATPLISLGLLTPEVTPAEATGTPAVRPDEASEKGADSDAES